MGYHIPLRSMASMLIAGLYFLLGPGALSREEKPQEGEVSFTPSALFRGELARLAPHLDLSVLTPAARECTSRER
jgi:hypothetical protein